MPCYFPSQALMNDDVDENGVLKKRLVFLNDSGKPDEYWKERFGDRFVRLPCGKCVGCMDMRARSWATRCMNEASLHEQNCFVTLTYADEYLPLDGKLCLRDVQLFLKRLRKCYGAGIRYFLCGEYGPNGDRPHYHLVVFGFDFPDKRPVKLLVHDWKQFSSESLDKLWGQGFTSVGPVTLESVRYVTRYCLKKASEVIGECLQVSRPASDNERPMLCTMSRRPGIGKKWIDKFYKDAYPSDFLIEAGRKVRVPRFYDVVYGKMPNNCLEDIKLKRIEKGAKHVESRDRLMVKMRVLQSKLNRLRRPYENESI